MRLIRGLHNATLRELCAREPYLQSRFADSDTKSVVTIGNFDGLHLGHQAIISRVKAEAEKRGVPSVVIVFEPQPMEFFKGKDAPPRLMRFRDKFEHIRKQGIDFLFCLRFDQTLSRLSPDDFVRKVLVRHLSLGHLVIGDDFRFGGDRGGDYNMLCQIGQALGYTVENTSTISVQQGSMAEVSEHSRSSSTLVRTLLAQADFLGAEKVLGKPYEISGRVVHGERLGRKIGFPTANIALHRMRAPLAGVFAVKVYIKSEQSKTPRVINGVANIGVKPTVGDFKANLEVHLFEFNENIYGQKVSVRFLSKLRDEARFNGVNELIAQIEKDVHQAKSYFSNEC